MAGCANGGTRWWRWLIGVRLRRRLIGVGLRRRSSGESRAFGLRHTLKLLRQPVEAGVDFTEFLAGQRGFTLDLGFAFALAASRNQFIMVVPMARSAALRRLILLGPASASARAAIVVTGLAGFVRTRLAALVVAPSLVIVVVISGPHRLAVIAVVLADDVVQPFPDRHAGAARGVAGGFARLWTKAPQVPRIAGFHLRAKPLREERDDPVLSLGSLTDEAEGAVLCPRRRLFRISVNKSLMRLRQAFRRAFPPGRPQRRIP